MYKLFKLSEIFLSENLLKNGILLKNKLNFIQL